MNTTVGQVFRCAAAAVLLSAFTSFAAPAQRFNISTNLMEYANLGTLNLDVSYGVARNWSVGAGVRCNPFKFESERRGVFFNRQQSYSVGARYWLWHINTGWWFGSKLRFQEYSSGGLFSDGSEEGIFAGGSGFCNLFIIRYYYCRKLAFLAFFRVFLSRFSAGTAESKALSANFLGLC